MIRSGTARQPGATARRDGGFAAQLLGQDGARRGLRGGEAVLKGARAAYLTVQWRGEEDRRPPTGLLRRLDV